MSATTDSSIQLDPPVSRERGGRSSDSRGVRESSGLFLGAIVRFLLALAATLLLLLFLALARRWEGRIVEPDTTLWVLSGVDAVMTAPPPPAPPSDPPPPPPETPPPPKVEIRIDSTAPAIRSSNTVVRPEIAMPHFDSNRQQERQRMVFSLHDLDDQPRLVNRPRVSFPDSLRRKGIREGRVSLEVRITPDGKVEVLRVIECSDPGFIDMAKQFATRARFTPPKKDGRPVAARFHWPLILR